MTDPRNYLIMLFVVTMVSFGSMVVYFLVQLFKLLSQDRKKPKDVSVGISHEDRKIVYPNESDVIKGLEKSFNKSQVEILKTLITASWFKRQN